MIEDKISSSSTPVAATKQSKNYRATSFSYNATLHEMTTVGAEMGGVEWGLKFEMGNVPLP